VGRKVARTIFFFFFAGDCQSLVAGGSERRTTTAGLGGTGSCRGWFRKNVRNPMFC
jgi:hypothetical protein